MRNGLLVVAAVVVVAGIAVARLGVTPAAGRAEAYTAPRTADGKPDLNGVWQAFSTANYDLQAHPARAAMALRPAPTRTEPGGLGRATPADLPAAPVRALGAVGGVPAGPGVVEGNEIPYQSWAAARKKENFDDWLTRDPEIKCYLPGVPRATYMPYPFQIVQSTNKIQMAYTFAGAARTIHLDKVEGPPDDTYMGHSVGRWEGDTLVVDVTSFNGRNWLDRAGNFHSAAMHLVERFTPIGPDALRYEATIEDPNVFTRSWQIAMPLYRRLEPNAQLIEYPCIEFAEEFLYGHVRKQQLVKHWEGDTIAVDIRRKVPPGEQLFDWYGK